jgi:SAM-dependent methyltransferase
LILEPTLSVLQQGWLWSCGFALFAAVMASCAQALASLTAIDEPRAPAATPRPALRQHALWFSLSAVASTLVLAVTNQLCQDLAVIPFLWIAPLALYLISFVLCFERERLASRGPWLAAVMVAGPACIYALFQGTDLAIAPQVAIFCGALLAYCMACHGELARSKPAPDHLTGFYLTVAAGGAAGGIFTGVLAPRLFPAYWELHLALLAGAALLVTRLLLDPGSSLNRGPAARVWSVRLSAAAAVAALGLALAGQAVHDLRGVEQVRRGFFGRLAVTREMDDEAWQWRKLRHGRTVHGAQFMDPARRLEPTTYYGPQSGLALALRRHPKRVRGEPLRLGVVGLGVGTFAVYMAPRDVARVYEINPDVVALSGGRQPAFTFLRDAPGAMTIRLGDGRLALEDEPSQRFDVLALDAFSGDAVPVHLLTLEAMALYLRHLGPGGVLAVHVSNKYLDLKPVVRGAAGLFMLHAVCVESAQRGPLWAADWILLARQAAPFEDPEVRAAAMPLAVDDPDLPVWTDDFSNLLGAVRWRD